LNAVCGKKGGEVLCFGLVLNILGKEGGCRKEKKKKGNIWRCTHTNQCAFRRLERKGKKERGFDKPLTGGKRVGGKKEREEKRILTRSAYARPSRKGGKNPVLDLSSGSIVRGGKRRERKKGG